MDNNKKSLGALVIGVPSGSEEGKGKEEGSEAGEMEHSPEELKALHDEAIDDVYDAMKAGNRDAFRDAFSAAVRVCNMAEEEGLYGDGSEEEG